MAAHSDLAKTSSTDAGLGAAMAATLALHKRLRGIAIDSDEGIDVVHDLRVALRRCRSLAQGLAVVDVSEAKKWRRLAKTAKGIFAGLGAVRDAQVMRGWTADLVTHPARTLLLARLDEDIARAAVEAAAAVEAFDVDAFAALSISAPARAAVFCRRRPVLLHLVLARWHEARGLHLEAMRRRTPESLHETRIGVKRLRYTIDSLLPDVHRVVAKPLKRMQAALGDLHDFDIAVGSLDAVLVAAGVGADDRTLALAPIGAARAERLATYKTLATGKTSAWATVRLALPTDPVVIERCRRAYIIEVAGSLGVDHHRARKAERAFAALAGVDAAVAVVDPIGRYAAIIAASRHRKRRRRAARDLLGFSADEKRRLEDQVRNDRLVVAAGIAASKRSARKGS